jgi:hypothetical protein
LKEVEHTEREGEKRKRTPRDKREAKSTRKIASVNNAAGYQERSYEDAVGDRVVDPPNL